MLEVVLYNQISSVLYGQLSSHGNLVVHSQVFRLNKGPVKTLRLFLKMKSLVVKDGRALFKDIQMLYYDSPVGAC